MELNADKFFEDFKEVQAQAVMQRYLDDCLKKRDYIDLKESVEFDVVITLNDIKQTHHIVYKIKDYFRCPHVFNEGQHLVHGDCLEKTVTKEGFIKTIDS